MTISKNKYKKKHLTAKQKGTLNDYAENPLEGLTGAVKKNYNVKPENAKYITHYLKHSELFQKKFRDLQEEVEADPRVAARKIKEAIETMDVDNKLLPVYLRMYYELKGEFVKQLDANVKTEDLSQQKKDSIREFVMGLDE